MIYNFTNHSFSYKPKSEPTFSLALYTLELEYNLLTGNLIDISGYLPLASAKNTDISIPPFKEGNIQFKVLEEYKIENGDAFDIFDKIPETMKYFIPQRIKYDENKGIIKIGAELTERDEILKINSNIICGINKNKVIKCIYLVPDNFE